MSHCSGEGALDGEEGCKIRTMDKRGWCRRPRGLTASMAERFACRQLLICGPSCLWPCSVPIVMLEFHLCMSACFLFSTICS